MKLSKYFRPRVFHLYLGKNLSNLNKLFHQTQIHSKVTSPILGVWLVLVDLFRKPFKDGNLVQKQLRSSPLRFDSNVYCFHEVKTGTNESGKSNYMI